MKLQKKLTETDVILNFMEDCKTSFVTQPGVNFEFPAGSWTGRKNRNIADIHGPMTPGIEAKSNFAACKKDVRDKNKNEGIEHYIYSTDTDRLDDEEIKFWAENGFSAAIFLINLDKWFIIDCEEVGFHFSHVLEKEKIYEIYRK